MKSEQHAARLAALAGLMSVSAALGAGVDWWYECATPVATQSVVATWQDHGSPDGGGLVDDREGDRIA